MQQAPGVKAKRTLQSRNKSLSTKEAGLEQQTKPFPRQIYKLFRIKLRTISWWVMSA